MNGNDDVALTWFHLPGSKPYIPGEQCGTAGLMGQPGYINLAVETTVSFHGLEGQVYRVVRSHLHIGHPDEAAGLHVFLEAE